MLARACKRIILARMRQLNTAERARIVSALVEGNSIRAISRITGFSRNAIDKLLTDLGRNASIYQDRTFRGLKCKRVQCDEIWSFVGAKQKNTTEETRAAGWGDVWTWVAMDADTKLVPCWYVGTRDAGAAYHFMHDLADRLSHRVQLTTDGYKPYFKAVEDAFGTDIDYAMLIKIYGEGPKTEARYSPAQCMGTRRATVLGAPDYSHVSTSYIERQNLTMRMSMRRFTRLTNVTPAMEAGLTDHVWSIEEICRMADWDYRLAA